MKRATLMLAALALLMSGVGQAKADFLTLNDPSASSGTTANGISGSNIVGYYYDGSISNGFLYNTTTNAYTTLNDPLATGGVFANGIDGSNVVGFYLDGTGRHGFLYNMTTNAYTALNDRVGASTSRTVLCQYVPNTVGYNIPKADPLGGLLMSKQSVKPIVVGPW